METVDVLLTCCVLCGFWNVLATILIFNALKKRGISVSFFWLRILAPVNTFKYKKITEEETGKAGSLFYHWIISINLALIFAIIAFIGLA
jgi:hypothetical protein